MGKDYLERYSKRTDNVVFLHIKRTKKPVEEKHEAPAEKVWSNQGSNKKNLSSGEK